MLADHAAQQLLDFNQKLDINLLDNVVNCLYHGVGPQVGFFYVKEKVTFVMICNPIEWTFIGVI